MTFEEALRVLEVGEEATTDEVRRAYLRLVKRHKPEQDPEGFQRVREAYEIARAGSDLSFGWVERAPRRGAAPESAAVVEPQLEASDAAAGFTDAEEANGKPNVDLVPAVSEEAAEEEDEEAPSVGEWFALLNAGNVLGAVPGIERSLDYAARFPLRGGVPGDMVLKAIAQLAAAGEAIQANRLTQALGRWVATLPAARDAFSANGALRWALLKELSQAESRLSAPAYEALGAMIVGNDSRQKIRLIQLRETHPQRALADYEHLRLTAPTLARTFGSFLNPETEPLAPARRSSFNVWQVVFGVFLIVNVLRVCRNLDFDSKRPTGTEVPAPVRIDVPPIVNPPVGMPAGSVDAERVERAATALVELGLGSEVSAVVLGLLTGTCDQAGEAMQRLEKATAEGAYEVRSNVQRLWAEFIVRCPDDVQKYQ